MVPREARDRVLEMGAYLQMTPALDSKLGYETVRGCYYGPLGQSSEGRSPPSREKFSSATSICSTPSGMSFRTRRALRHGTVLRADRAPGRGPHAPDVRDQSDPAARRPPGADHPEPGFAAFHLGPAARLPSGAVLGLPPARGRRRPARRAASPGVHPHRDPLLLEDAGFQVAQLDTGPFRAAPSRPCLVVHLLERYRLTTVLRGEGIYALGRKQGPVKNRYPAWLYSQPAP